MNADLNPSEREVLKLIGLFKKRAEKLTAENKPEESFDQLIETCDKLSAQIDLHATKRSAILHDREQLQNLVKDNARCPKCSKMDKLKLTGTDKSKEGWVSNKYKCRNCNIEFVWNAPNNPWDMVAYVEKVIREIEKAENNENVSKDEKKHYSEAMEQMKNNLGKLRPIVEASTLDFAELQEREKEMEELLSKFKKHLMIEKIRMDF
ncbi:MAG: hypothetical protein ACXVC6_08880 [Bacteroidia bacterium]